jgi:hypothetical protein
MPAAIVIGKTNLQLAFGITSTNLARASFAGPVKTQYDKTRIPGGSSSGLRRYRASCQWPQHRHGRTDSRCRRP